MLVVGMAGVTVGCSWIAPRSSQEKVKATSLDPQSLQTVVEALDRQCWITYTPSTFDPTTTPIAWPTLQDLRADLTTLREAGFKGLVTYRSFFADSDAENQALELPRIAQDLGFEGLILGVWNPESKVELQAAEKAGRSSIVLGYTIGNEGLDHRYNLATLSQAMNQVRAATGKPVTTTEEAKDYFLNPKLQAVGDWIFPNVHPYFAGLRDPEKAVSWTVEMYDRFMATFQKPVVFKEVGLPTGGDPQVSEVKQQRYYQLLRKTQVNYVVFTGFDLPWKRSSRPQLPGQDPEPYWGVFGNDRQPKLAALDRCHF